MQDTPGPSNGSAKLAKRKPAEAESREERLKAALKANMARRKAQAKARADNEKEDE